MCHSEGGLSFPLETYEQTWLRGRGIRIQAIARHMPPWAAVPGYGEFANDNSLTLRESQFLVSWVEGLGPRNAGTVFTNVVDSAGKPRPAVRAAPHTEHWQAGEPGLVRRLDAVTVNPDEGNRSRRAVIDLGLGTERRLRAFEYMPGDRRVVRAASFWIQETGQWIGSWTPWYGFIRFPENAALELPARSHVLAVIEYRAGREPVAEAGSIALTFAGQAVPNAVSSLTMETRTAGPGRFRAELRLEADTHAVALLPELTAGVRSIEVSGRRPDGGTDILLLAKDIPADWPTPYVFKSPVLLRRGTLLSVTTYGAPAKLTINRY
jgi:hypothetical protein